MKLKVGNKLCCKNSVITPDGKIHFVKNKSYEIKKIKYHTAGHITYYIFQSEYSDNSHMPVEQIDYFFYSKKELRKVKLDKVNDISPE